MKAHLCIAYGDTCFRGLHPLPLLCYDHAMAIFHCSAKIFKRSEGKNSLASAAYRSGQELYDERTETRFKFAGADRVMHTEIIAPADAPEWALDRQGLWNSVEQSEKRKDSQLAREFELALPVELDLDQQRDLVRGWAAAQFTAFGIVADVAIHDGRRSNKPANPHAHVMTSMRTLHPTGWDSKKHRAFEDRAKIEEWRSSWADHANQALKLAGHDVEISHLSHAARGLAEKPQIKEGLAARGIEAKGGISDRMDENRRIRDLNKRLRDRLKAIKDRVLDALGKAQPSPSRPMSVREMARSIAKYRAKQLRAQTVAQTVAQPKAPSALMAQVAKMRADQAKDRGPDPLTKSLADARAEQPPSPPIAQTVAVEKPVVPPVTPAPPPPMPEVDIIEQAWLAKKGRGGR
jgi:ATP-dependent exoDNAse (exonuclease V) alpha subunit